MEINRNVDVLPGELTRSNNKVAFKTAFCLKCQNFREQSSPQLGDGLSQLCTVCCRMDSSSAAAPCEDPAHTPRVAGTPQALSAPQTFAVQGIPQLLFRTANTTANREIRELVFPLGKR